jgi:hypothetical protein
MDGWMDGWMDRWMDRWREERRKGQGTLLNVVERFVI